MKFPNTQIPKKKIADFFDAIREIRHFQKKPVLGKCMFWSDDCISTPIGSHLLAHSWLEHVADDTKHIVQLQMMTENLGNQSAQIGASRIGINHATTFPGFCEKHDNDIFACLEKQTFAAKEEQLIALRYRSVCREACAKHQMVAGHLPRALDEAAPTQFTARIVAEMKRCISLLAEKQALEEMLLGRENFITSYIVKFAKTPTVLASATIYPPVTFTGRLLEFREEWLTVSVIPAAVGGWAVFSWSKKSPKNSSLLVKSFTKVPRVFQTEALLNLVFEVSENHAISPTWWECLSSFHKNDLMRRFGRSLSIKGDDRPPASTLLASAEPWIDWQPIEAGYA